MPAAPKIACDVKSALLMLDRLGIEARGFEHDVMLYAFLLDADPSGCPLEEQARRRLDLKLGAAPEQHADITLEIWNSCRRRSTSAACASCTTTIELPLAGVLARMERTGIRIDPVELRRLSALMETEIARLTAEIHAAGRQALQHQLAAAARQGAVRGSEAARAGEVRQGQDHLHRRRRAGGAGGRSRDRPQGAGVPAAHQAEGHVRGCAAGADRSGHRPPAHQLQPDRRGHRAALLLQSEPAEHSRSGPNWAARSAPPSCRARDGS